MTISHQKVLSAAIKPPYHFPSLKRRVAAISRGRAHQRTGLSKSRCINTSGLLSLTGPLRCIADGEHENPTDSSESTRAIKGIARPQMLSHRPKTVTPAKAGVRVVRLRYPANSQGCAALCLASNARISSACTSVRPMSSRPFSRQCLRCGVMSKLKPDGVVTVCAARSTSSL